MAIKSRGFTLYIAIVFLTVLTAIGTILASFIFKQTQLASAATQSQYAFYAADAALECALMQDQQSVPSIFAYSQHGVATNLLCGDNQSPGYSVAEDCYNTSSCSGYRYTHISQINLDNGAHCADVTVYKPSAVTSVSYFFAQGYNVPCTSVNSGVNVVARGLEAHY